MFRDLFDQTFWIFYFLLFQTLCTLAGIGLQYFFLVNFACLLLEALHVLSILSVVVETESFFSTGSNILIAWGNCLNLLLYQLEKSYKHEI